MAWHPRHFEILRFWPGRLSLEICCAKLHSKGVLPLPLVRAHLLTNCANYLPAKTMKFVATTAALVLLIAPDTFVSSSPAQKNELVDMSKNKRAKRRIRVPSKATKGTSADESQHRFLKSNKSQGKGSRNTSVPSSAPSMSPNEHPSSSPSSEPSTTPSTTPSSAPSTTPSAAPSLLPSTSPSKNPSEMPSQMPSMGCMAGPTSSCYFPVENSPQQFYHCGINEMPPSCNILICPAGTVWNASDIIGDGACVFAP